MADPVDDVNDDDAGGVAGKRRKSGSEDGETSAGSAISKMLTTKRAAQVQGDHRHLIGADLIDAIVEFCQEGIMVVSAHAAVAWNKGLSVITSFISFIKSDLPSMARSVGRNVGSGTQSPQKHKPPTNTRTLGVTLKPSGPSE